MFFSEIFLLILYSVIILFVVTLLLVMRWPSYRTYKMVSKIHGPKGWPFFGLVFFLATLKPTELLDILKSYLEQYPRIVKIWVVGVPMVAVQEPEDLEVLLSSTQHISKGEEYNPLRTWLKDGLLTSSGEIWHTRRKMLTNTFHFRILEDILPVFNKNAKLLCKKLLATQGDIPIESFVKLCTLDIICESAMGVSLGAQNNQGKQYVNSIERLCAVIIKRVLHFYLHPEMIFSVSSYGKTFNKMMKALREFSDKVIDERRWKYYSQVQTEGAPVKKRQAFLDTLLEFEKNNPGKLTQDDIRQEVDTFTFEGHDTTSAAIVNALFLLGHHQDVQEKVVSELEDIFLNSNRDVEMKDLQKMSYLEMVIKETLRLFPSVPYFSRHLEHDLVFADNLVVPSGCNAVVIPFFVHRNERFFPDSERFDPERFSTEEVKSRHPFSYVPFSAGPRNCIGQKFAMMELKITLSTILRQAKVISITKREDIKYLPFIILRPHIPIIVQVSSRNNAQQK